MAKRLFLFFSLLLSFSAHAGVWGERGISQRFVVSGNLLYDADGRGVSVYDVSNPAAIRRIDIESSDDETTDLALFGTTDLVTATPRGVARYALASDGTLTPLGFFELQTNVEHIAAGTRYVAASNETEIAILERSEDTLAQVRRITTSDRVRALAFVGDSLYAAVEGGGILVYAPPSATVVKALPATADSFALSGTTLWAGSVAKGLTAIDVRTPAAPRVAGNAEASVLKLAGVAASGSRVYGFQAPDTIATFDGSDPDEPHLLDTFRQPVDVIAANGDRVFISAPDLDSEKKRYESGKPVRVFVNGALAGEYEDLAGPVSGVWTDGSLAYVIDPPYLRVLDVSKTDMPRELSHITIPEIQERIRVKNGMAVIYGRKVVHLVDVSDPLVPRYAGMWDIQGHYPSSAAVAADGTFVEANEHSGMHIVDYTDPTNAHLVGWRKQHYHDMAAGADAIYVVEHDLFFTFQIENRTKIVDRQVEHIIYKQLDIAPPNSDYPTHVVLRGPDGVRVYSLEDRYAPRLRANLQMDDAGPIATGDGVAYVTKDGSLHLLDLVNPNGLTDTGMRVAAPQQISVAGEKIVVADRYSIRVYGPDTASPVPAPIPRRRGVRH